MGKYGYLWVLFDFEFRMFNFEFFHIFHCTSPVFHQEYGYLWVYFNVQMSECAHVQIKRMTQ